MKTRTHEKLWNALEEIADPEIPVVNLVEMGIIRDVQLEEGVVRVTMTPTFSGCPALDAMKDLIREQMKTIGFENAEVFVSLTPPWTTDDITDEAKEKLRVYGLAPPPPVCGDLAGAVDKPAVCPFCDSGSVTLKNPFGSTPCRKIYYCEDCQQPFEQFKPL